MLERILKYKFINLATIVIGGYIMVKTSHNILDLWSSRNRLIQAQKNVAELQEKNKKLQELTAIVDNSTFVEREARDKLGLVKEGEVVLVLPQDEVNKLAQSLRLEYIKSNSSVQELSNWQKWLKLFTD